MLFMENAREHFAMASSIIDCHSEEVNFYHRFAEMIPDRINVDTLVLAFKIALRDEDRRGRNTLSFIALIPHYVRQGASMEFAHEFRKKYNGEVLGLTQEDLPDVDFGVIEVEKDVLDISNKDRCDVLAALYNASTPAGMGFMEYNPLPWTREFAKMYFEKYAREDEEHCIRIKWILGRPINCTFVGNLVYVAGYNNDNEWGLAQRAIATCPNVEIEKKI